MPRKVVVNLDEEFSASQVRQACDRVGAYAQRVVTLLQRLSPELRREALTSETLRSLTTLRGKLDEVRT